jgi:simple sugar transport system substrate-binding protein
MEQGFKWYQAGYPRKPPLMNPKFKLWLAFAVTLLIPIVSHAQTKPRIIVVTHGQAADSFWLIVRNGVEIATEETNSDVEYRAPERFDVQAMAQLIDEAVASKPDALVVSIPDAAALSKSIKAAVAARIPVISINSGLEVSRKLGCLMYIGQDEEAAGRKAGQKMKVMGVKEAIILNQEVGNFALEQRIKGFRAGFEGPFHHVQVLAVKMDFGECQDLVRDYLQRNQNVDGIMALGPTSAEPALAALDQLGKTGQIKLCTFDISPAVIAALARKQMEFAIDQQEWLQGYLPIVFLANYVRYGSILQNDFILTGPSLVTSENAGKVVNLLSLGFH